MGLLTKDIETGALHRRDQPLLREPARACALQQRRAVYPGDEVKVHGPEIMAPFGEIVSEDREATIFRACASWNGSGPA